MCIWYECMCLGTCAEWGAHVCVHMWRTKVDRGMLFDHSPVYLLSQGLSMDLEDTSPSQLVMRPVPSCLPSAGITGRSHTSWVFNLGSEDLNPGPHSCIASALSISLSQKSCLNMQKKSYLGPHSPICLGCLLYRENV